MEDHDHTLRFKDKMRITIKGFIAVFEATKKRSAPSWSSIGLVGKSLRWIGLQLVVAGVGESFTSPKAAE